MWPAASCGRPFISLSIQYDLSFSLKLLPARCTSACNTTVLNTRDFRMPLQLKVKINAQLGQFKRNLSLTFPCYLSGHPVNIDELKCTSSLSQQHSTLTTSLAEALFVGPYDFRDTENVEGIAESSNKNGIYSLTRNVTEFNKIKTESGKM